VPTTDLKREPKLHLVCEDGIEERQDAAYHLFVPHVRGYLIVAWREMSMRKPTHSNGHLSLVGVDF